MKSGILLLLATLLAIGLCFSSACSDGRSRMTDEERIKLHRRGTVAEIGQALKDGVIASVRDKNMALMMTAASNPDPEVTRTLLRAGAEVDAQDDALGYTALMWAAGADNLEAMRALLEAGADVNIRSKFGQTALLTVADHRHNPEAVELLLAAGTDVNARDNYNRSALALAAGRNSAAAVRALLAAGAEVNARYDEGMTALMLAAKRSCDPGVVRALLEAGADVDAKDDEGRDALWHARHFLREGTPDQVRTAQPAILELLEKAARKPAPPGSDA